MGLRDQPGGVFGDIVDLHSCFSQMLISLQSGKGTKDDSVET
jgi:hypothetical protein